MQRGFVPGSLPSGVPFLKTAPHLFMCGFLKLSPFYQHFKKYPAPAVNAGGQDSRGLKPLAVGRCFLILKLLVEVLEGMGCLSCCNIGVFIQFLFALAWKYFFWEKGNLFYYSASKSSEWTRFNQDPGHEAGRHQNRLFDPPCVAGNGFETIMAVHNRF